MGKDNFTRDSLFKDYFYHWIKLYKEGAVRQVTLEKYQSNYNDYYEDNQRKE